MTGDHLRQLRTERKLTRDQLAEELGDCTASSINKWERGINPVPLWVEEKMLSHVRMTWPLHELHQLLDLAREENTDLGSLLSQAARMLLAERRQRKEAATGEAKIYRLPPSHWMEDSSFKVAEEPPADKAGGEII